MPAGSPVFLVDPYSDPVLVRIVGRASFQNVVPLRDFLQKAFASESRHFVVDFGECLGMDSTVLGVLAGTALELRRMEPRGSLVLTNMGQRNLELVRNLGLHRIATVDEGRGGSEDTSRLEGLSNRDASEIERARLCLDAHENLIEADASNQAKFQDVVTYLKNQVDDEDS